MKSTTMQFLSAIALCTISATNAFGKEPSIGSKFEGGIFLHREPVEIFWNDWTLYPTGNKKTGQAQGVITGEGKTVRFIGNLSVNCQNLNSYWRSASNDDQALPDKAAAQIVPLAALKNAKKFLCKK